MAFLGANEAGSSRDRILDAAEGLFAQRGYSGVGMREVAEAVGLGKSSVFHHFESKAVLYSAVSIRILATIEETLVRSLARGGAPGARLERSLGELIDLLATRPTYARLLLRSLFEDDDLPQDGPEAAAVGASIQGIMGPVARLLKEGMRVGDFRIGSVPHLLLLLVGTIVFPFSSGGFGEDLLGTDVFDSSEVERIKRQALDLVSTGLSAART